MACGSKKDIHVHHLTYERMGHELDSDLMVLCEVCHDKVHQLHRTSMKGKSLEKVTRIVVDKIQKAYMDRPPVQQMTREQQERRAEERRASRERSQVERKKDRKQKSPWVDPSLKTDLGKRLQTLSSDDLERLFTKVTGDQASPGMNRTRMIKRIVAGQMRRASGGRIGSS